eukprot:TRINITY_DN36317_c0_g1_i1.p1 TRINITY_DN36317_c0_g1~~TRINITY_DN36317_c0_g1_i1.p1  ORF type:complete len:294 (+),score=95.23 TRINITY_DN36317_c0_g1_i1:64-882(+)
MPGRRRVHPDAFRRAVDPFLLACDSGDLERVQELMRSGQDPDYRHPPNSVHGAGRSGSAEGSPVYNPGVTGLMLAARGGHAHVVRYLLEAAKAKPDALDDETWNALHYACFSGHADCATALIRAGCPQDVISKFEKATPLGFATHRRFAACAAAFPSPVHPAALTQEEEKAVCAKALGKLQKAQRQGKPFLHRYFLADDEWASVARYLKDERVRQVSLNADDAVLGREVRIVMSKNPETHFELNAELRRAGDVLRTSSCSGAQHCVVVPATG